ncbi:hypothetical protein J6590_090950 [Homalodisca vitripennis]|nr:hypothetical protein J6590_090950 [Homalodisca vitripennis]
MEPRSLIINPLRTRMGACFYICDRMVIVLCVCGGGVVWVRACECERVVLVANVVGRGAGMSHRWHVSDLGVPKDSL